MRETHFYKIHPGESDENRSLNVECRICRRDFDAEEDFHRHDCAKVLQDKFVVNGKEIDQLLSKGRLSKGLFAKYRLSKGFIAYSFRFIHNGRVAFCVLLYSRFYQVLLKF